VPWVQMHPVKKFGGCVAPSRIGLMIKTFASVSEPYRQLYFEVFDTIISSLEERFPSHVFQHMTNIEQFIIGHMNGDSVVQFYKQDLNAERLQLHRDMFLDIARQRRAKLTCFGDALDVFRGSAQEAIKLSQLLPEMSKLFCLALTIPVTTCTSERSFSTLRRLKTYLRSTMVQERLNHVAILHVHKKLCDELNLDDIANDFIKRSSVRCNTFHMSSDEGQAS